MTPGPNIIKKCEYCGQLLRYFTLASFSAFGAKLWTDGYSEAYEIFDRQILNQCPSCEKPIWECEQEKLGEADPYVFCSGKVTDYEIIIESVGENRIKLLKLVRELTKCSYSEAKAIVDNPPINLNALIKYDSAYDFARAKIKGQGIEYKVIEHERKFNLDFPELWLSALTPQEYTDVKDLRLVLEKKKDDLSVEKEKYIRRMIMYLDNHKNRKNDGKGSLVGAHTGTNIIRLAEILDENKSQDRLLKAEILRNLGEFEYCINMLNHKFSKDQLYISKFICSLARNKVSGVREIELDPNWQEGGSA